MSMIIDLDFEDSLNKVAPQGEYGLRLKTAKQENSKNSGKPMITTVWEIFDPPAHVNMDELRNSKGEAMEVPVWISLQPNALFTLKEVLFAAKQDLTCKQCSNLYPANMDRCPACQSTKFSFDFNVFQTGLEIGAMLQPGRNKDNTRDVTQPVKFFPRA